MKLNVNKKSIILPAIILFIFCFVAVSLFLVTRKLFYLLNFTYIGATLSICIFLSNSLPKNKLNTVRKICQLLIGTYLLFFLGIILKENLQIEGFWFYLFSGIFAGATLHYLIAKIFGTVFFGRGWCGWACWTAMILDLFPWTQPKRKVNKKLSKLRYLHFFIVLATIIFICFFTESGKNSYFGNNTEIYWLFIGNFAYYLIGFLLAYILKDNRAFCKYVCPIPVFQKIGAKYSFLKVKINKEKCIDCKACEKNCPMQINLLEYKNKNQRILSTECILCSSCIYACPKDAIHTSFEFDKKEWTR